MMGFALLLYVGRVTGTCRISKAPGAGAGAPMSFVTSDAMLSWVSASTATAAWHTRSRDCSGRRAGCRMHGRPSDEAGAAVRWAKALVFVSSASRPVMPCAFMLASFAVMR